MAKTVTIDLTKSDSIKPTYNLKGVTDIIFVTNETNNFIERFKKLSASGSTLTVDTNIDKTIIFTNVSNPEALNIKGQQSDGEGYYYTQIASEFYNIDKFVTARQNDSWIPKKQGTKVNGSTFDDIIDVHTGYNPSDKNKKKNIGLTINSGLGDDKITGTALNDTITGGLGTNNIDYDTNFGAFGNDTIKLTKGEKLNLNFKGIDSVSYYQDTKNKNDLKITTDNGTVTLKNYYGKDTGAEVDIYVGSAPALDLTKTASLGEINRTNYFEPDGKKANRTYIGSALADEVNATGVSVLKNKGVTINTGLGDDIITGSNYADNITGGKGENVINYTVGNGNDTINLTKDEKLTINMTGIIDDDVNNLRFEYAKKDLRIYTNKNDTSPSAEYITLKNFASKDVTGADGKVNLEINGNTYDLRTNQKDGEYWLKITPNKTNFTGGWQNDYVDASESEELKTGKNKHINMVFNGGAGTDKIIGSNYADTIKAGTGTGDVLIGGQDKDLLYASTTKDSETTFVFNKGDGQDTIYSGKGQDTLVFNDITKLNDIGFERNGKNLNVIYSYKTVDDKQVAKDYVTLNNYFKSAKNDVVVSSVKYIEFDGHKVDIETLRNYAGNIKESYDTNINGTEENDLIFATGTSAQNMSGKKGNDVIYASNHINSNEYIDGGEGDDIIYGSNFNGSDGHPVNVGHGSYYSGTGNNTVYAGEYSTKYIYLNGGNDTVYTSTDARNSLGGYAQNQIFVDYGSKDGGHDTIYWQGSSSVLLRMEKSTKDDLFLTRENKSNDLVIRYGNDNSVTLKDYYKSGNEGMANLQIVTKSATSEGNYDFRTIAEAIEYQDGVKIQIKGVKGTVNNDYIVGTNKKETITGNKGNDLINPQGGDDEINLGEGNDMVMAGDGNKVITAVSGNNTINLGSGNNTVIAGTGSDTITSGLGANVIEFSKDDTANDTYTYGSGSDTLVLKGDKLSDLSLNTQMSYALLTQSNEKTIKISGLDDLTKGVTIKDSTGATSNLFNLNTTAGAETADHTQKIVTGNGNDTLYSGLKNDTIYAGSGVNEINLVVAESGNNNIYTYAGGTDTFIVKDAQDFDNLVFHKDDDDLIVGYNNDVANNTVKISGYFSSKTMQDKLFMKAGESAAVTIESLLEQKGFTETIHCKEDNHTIDASESTKPVSIIGCKSADDITGTDYADSINGNGGGDALNGGAGSDTYTIDSTAYGIAQDVISDTSGDNDKLLLGANDGEANAFFYVTLNKEDGEVVMNGLNATYTTGNDLYINKSSEYTFDNATTSNGVKIENYFTENGKIEQIRNADDTSDIFESRQIGAVGQAVANWLYKNGYDSVADVINNSKSKDDDAIAADKAALLGLYKPKVSIMRDIYGTSNDDLIIASTNGNQNVWATQGGNDVIYMSDRYANQYVSAGNGDDVIYGSNYKTNSGQGEYYTGNGNNVVYAGDYCTKYIHLGNDNDTVFTSTDAGFELPSGYYYRPQNQIFIDDGNKDGGHDTIYWQGTPNVILRFKQRSHDELYATRTGESNDIVIRYGKDNSITMKDYYVGDNADKMKNFNIWTSDENTTINNLAENQGGVKNYLEFDSGAGLSGTANSDYISCGENVIGISGGAGSDAIITDGYTTVYTNINTSNGKDTTEGVTDTVMAYGSSKNTIYAQSETNKIVSNGNSQDLYYAYIDQKTTIEDKGDNTKSDSLYLTNTTETTDGAKSNLHILFNVSAGYDYDSEDVTTLFNGDVLITAASTKDNYDLWVEGDKFSGVSVVGNAVENICSSDNYKLTNVQVSELAESVATWLTNNGYTNVDGVFSNELNKDDNNSADIAALVAQFDNAVWKNPA